MTRLRFGTYNLREYRRRHPDGERERWDQVAEIIRQADADVWAVQEVAHDDALYRLAEATGLHCVANPQDPYDAIPVLAYGEGRDRFGSGLLWQPGITPVPDTLLAYPPERFVRGLVRLVLDVEGTPLQVMSTHLTPFGRAQRVTEAEWLLAAITWPDAPPAIVGSDSNSISGDRVHCDGTWDNHARDPYENQDWYPELAWQCRWRYDDTGRRTHWADRDPGDVLWSAGLMDTSAILNLPITPSAMTVGYWPGDPYPERDIDHVRVTRDLAAAVRAVRVHRTEQAMKTSDHLPKVAQLELV